MSGPAGRVSAWRRTVVQALRRARGRFRPRAADIPNGLWQSTLQAHGFLQRLDTSEQDRLRALCAAFLARKQFHGADGVQITDAMALAISAQACLPLLHWGPRALDAYDDFVGIVVHPDAVLAPRVSTDEAGVVHHWNEELIGEAMDGGPVMLAWSQVARAGDDAGRGHNLVIHEFAHKIDMAGKSFGQAADGCPVLPRGFMGLASARQARQTWQALLTQAHQDLVRQVEMAERFGAQPPGLDAYGATSPSEFFAVSCEAYWVNRERLRQDFPRWTEALDAFFQRGR